MLSESDKETVLFTSRSLDVDIAIILIVDHLFINNSRSFIYRHCSDENVYKYLIYIAFILQESVLMQIFFFFKLFHLKQGDKARKTQEISESERN